VINWGNAPYFEVRSQDGSFGFSYFPGMESYGGEFRADGQQYLIVGNKNSPAEISISPTGGFLAGVFIFNEMPIEVDILFECDGKTTN